MSELFIVPTPIGNLEDMSYRAISVLKKADIILTEDTRTSSKLLQHYNIKNLTYSYHMHNEHKVYNKYIALLKSGKTIALITDAGTPGISDPGFLIVRESIVRDIEVFCLPGATAFVPALVLSGLPCDKFIFEGFLPLKKGRKARLEILSQEYRTMIFYESPHKLLKTLEDIKSYFGQYRQISISREITKLYEQTIRGNVSEVSDYFRNNTIKGEFVIVVKGINR